MLGAGCRGNQATPPALRLPARLTNGFADASLAGDTTELAAGQPTVRKDLALFPPSRAYETDLAQFKDDEDGRTAKKAFQEYVNSKNLGMVIQSTCTVLPGDRSPLATNTTCRFMSQ